jgi:hypothetical protein
LLFELFPAPPFAEVSAPFVLFSFNLAVLGSLVHTAAGSTGCVNGRSFSFLCSGIYMQITNLTLTKNQITTQNPFQPSHRPLSRRHFHRNIDGTRSRWRARGWRWLQLQRPRHQIELVWRRQPVGAAPLPALFWRSACAVAIIILKTNGMTMNMLMTPS